ncbi:MAG: hypothetical protein WCE69_03830 [Aestuariivirga sp.]
METSRGVRLCFALALVFATGATRAAEAPWSSGDYVDLYFRHYNGHVPLPHLRDPVQKALFNHLIDPANIARIQEAPVTADEKLRQLRIILAVLGAYRAAYNVAVMVGEPLQQELTLVQVHALEVADAVARLMQKSPGDAGSPTASATLIEGVIESVGDSATYSPAQRATMADAVTLHYPVIKAVLGPDERRNLRAQAMKLDDVDSLALRQMKRIIGGN